MDKTVVDKFKSFVSDSEEARPVISTAEIGEETEVTRTDISVSSSEEALEETKKLMRNSYLEIYGLMICILN